MSIPRRNSDPASIRVASRTFFVTSSTLGKRALLQSHRSAQLFTRVLYGYRASGKFRLHAFVVMPDHFHALLTVGPDISVERAVQFIKGGFSFQAAKEFGKKGTLWQRGFSEVRILDEGHFHRCCDYIHSNPVKKRLVSDAAAYEYSSANPVHEVDPMPQGLKPLPFREP